MKIGLIIFICAVCLGCSPTTFYIVRHAEKEAAVMTPDVPLSAQGTQHAQALKAALQEKQIAKIFSTAYVRTVATAQPLSEALHIPIETYNAADTGFINVLKKYKGINVLIVGHSNTVDDLVNGLTGKMILHDLPDTQYGDLFIVKKWGRRYHFSKVRFGL
ncbi:MAG TPA: phosphoglycerate mutase family protein [Chitinophagaceae bacterium]|nr:phosphoglycerate mutase family protein [Chitinophagaceae bacterium]